MAQVESLVFQFAGMTLDERRGTLTRTDEQLFLRPKAFNLLLHLARNVGRVVPKAELMDAIWPEVYVTEDSLTQTVREIRRTIGNDYEELIRTVPRRGYMLIAPIETDSGPTGLPIVAVLRFRNIGGGDFDGMVDGFAEDIILGLSQAGTFTVLSRASSFLLPSPVGASPMTSIGADYLIEGSIRWSDKEAAISVSLIDAMRRSQIWGARYEIELSEIFSTQSRIIDQIVARLVGRLDEDVTRRTIGRPNTSLSAYESLQRGISILHGPTGQDGAGAQVYFEQAIATDPSFGPAHSLLAEAKLTAADFVRASEEQLRDALASAARGVALAPSQSLAWRIQGWIRCCLRQFQGAEDDLRRAVSLNRSDAEAMELMGYLLAIRGRPVEALSWIDRAITLNPLNRQWYNHDRSLALYELGEYAAAVETLEFAPTHRPWIDLLLAACFAKLNNREKARHHIESVLSHDPEMRCCDAYLSGRVYEHASDNAHLIEGIRLALHMAGKTLRPEAGT